MSIAQLAKASLTIRVGIVPTLTKEIHGMCIFLTSEEAENWAPNQLHKTSQKDYNQFKISIMSRTKCMFCTVPYVLTKLVPNCKQMYLLYTVIFTQKSVQL